MRSGDNETTVSRESDAANSTTVSEDIANMLLCNIPYLGGQSILIIQQDPREGHTYPYNSRPVPSGEIFAIWGKSHAP